MTVINFMRHRPPPGLSDDAKEIWYDIVASQPDDWLTPERAKLVAEFAQRKLVGRWIRRAVYEMPESAPFVDWAALFDLQGRQTDEVLRLFDELGLSYGECGGRGDLPDESA
jgi:hypothetical protein